MMRFVANIVDSKTAGFSALLFACLALAAQPAAATTITAAGSVVQDSIPGGGLGDSGYIFYTPKPFPSPGVAGPDLVVQPSFVTGFTDDAASLRFHPASGTYSTITIAGTPYDTGLNYRTTSGDLTTINLDTTDLPTSFQLGLLGNNYNYNGVGRPSVSLTVTADGSGSFATQAVLQAPTDFPVNRFYLFDVTDLTPGDTITISGVTGVDGLLLGGLTFTAFNAAVIPEPSTLGLLSLGIVSFVARRKKQRRV